MRVVSRAEAEARGLTWYFTGKPCGRGHICRRNVCNHTCRECNKVNAGSSKADHGRAAKAAFHRQWLAERKKSRADRKRALELLS